MPDPDRDPTLLETCADQTVCYCMDVTAGSLRTAIAAGARTVTDLQNRTGACTGCGTCREDLLRMLSAHDHNTEAP